MKWNYQRFIFEEKHDVETEWKKNLMPHGNIMNTGSVKIVTHNVFDGSLSEAFVT